MPLYFMCVCTFYIFRVFQSELFVVSVIIWTFFIVEYDWHTRTRYLRTLSGIKRIKYSKNGKYDRNNHIKKGIKVRVGQRILFVHKQVSSYKAVLMFGLPSIGAFLISLLFWILFFYISTPVSIFFKVNFILIYIFINTKTWQKNYKWTSLTSYRLQNLPLNGMTKLTIKSLYYISVFSIAKKKKTCSGIQKFKKKKK